MKYRALDLFCGAGGVSMGLFRAGFDVVGVDIRPQRNYPFEFMQGDALDACLDGFDFVWASPPCQAYSKATPNRSDGRHPDLVAPVRSKLQAWGGPWIIENVPGAPLRKSIVLDGSCFGLNLFRRRWFESNLLLLAPQGVPHAPGSSVRGEVPSVYGHGGGKGNHKSDWCKAMGIDWMEVSELAQAIPPAYSECLARQVLAQLEPRQAAA